MGMEEIIINDAFYEQLPAQCPPKYVEHPQLKNLWRLTRSELVTSNDFYSERYLNSNRNFRCDCLGSSVSLVPTFEQISAAVKMPSMKKKNFTHAVSIKCEKSFGVWHLDRPTHCNFWPYVGFDYKNAIVEVKKI